ncbi:MAG: hypothetical protein AB7L17_21475, partial [Ilumatobacteraceae bacterium]
EMGRGTWWSAVGGVVALSVLVTACGEPEFEYPHDAAEGVYFKVPREWTVFDQTAEFLEGRVDGQATSTPLRLWTIDSNRPADADNAAAFDGDRPVGTAQIIEVVPSLSERLSIADLRSIGFEFDPVNPATGLEDTWEVVLDQPLRTKDGISGAVAMFNHRATSDDEWLSQAREVFLDPTRQRVYILDLYCSAACFEANQDEIFDVLDSWRIDL